LVSLEELGNQTGNQKALVLASTLNAATGKFLDENKSPSRKVNELDNRGSHFYLAMYWSQALATQTDDGELQEQFTSLASELSDHETAIVQELNDAQGSPVDIGGYFHPNSEKAEAAMRASQTFNAAVESFLNR
jgi:isocitrate dehydrogenase